MSDLVERVARAIAAGAAGDEDLVNKRYDIVQKRWEAIARAAVGAMREPTAAMIKAGYDPSWPESLGDAYRAMIDAAKNEP